MSMTDPLGDMITRIRNAQMRKLPNVKTPVSALRARVLDVLEREGYIQGYTRTDFDGGKAEFDIQLKYHEEKPVIRRIERVSKPGRRVYSSVKSIPIFHANLGISILSTPKGVMSDSAAREENVGGEILCRVF